MNEYTELIEALITLIGVIYGLWKGRQAIKATAENNLTQSLVDGTFIGNTIPEGQPAYLFAMSEATKKYITKDLPQDDKDAFYRQVADAEYKRLKEYSVYLSKGYMVILQGELHGNYYAYD